MKISYIIIYFSIAVCAAYVIYKSKFSILRPKKYPQLSISSDKSHESNFLKEFELIRGQITSRYINYNIYNITIEKNLSNEIIDHLFKDRLIEYGRPNIDLPTKFFTDSGIQAITEWLLQRGVILKSDGTMSMELSDYFVNETRPQAERIVENAIAAIEKQKAG